MLRPIHLIQLAQSFGPKWLASRLGYSLRLKTGLIRYQCPNSEWAANRLKDLLTDESLAEPAAYLEYRRALPAQFFFSDLKRNSFTSFFREWDKDDVNSPCRTADEILSGTLSYFSHLRLKVGFPPQWHHNPLTKTLMTPHQHWSRIGDFGAGDMKVIWEPNRFGFTYALTRAYWRSGNNSFCELFWRALEDWRDKNPPQRGANWKCGQEISFRIMAWCFGLFGFLTAEGTTSARVVQLAEMINLAAHRIEKNLAYAVSQNNNHGVSEAVGLWTTSLLFPEFRSSSRWRKIARTLLEDHAGRLIYDDGSFAQHSTNYQRVMLHDYIWALRLGDLNRERLSSELRSRLSGAVAFLYQVQDAATGQVPNYGPNDGALVLPLNNCDYRDFRPIIQTGQYACTETICYDHGPWDEDLLWLFGAKALHAQRVRHERSDLMADAGGYYTLRSKSGFVFTRCATYRNRPNEADMLHVDLWWRGHNVALDAGTYSYNAPDPWNNELAKTAYHNTVTVDGLDQMDRVGKFLWLPWLRSSVTHNLTSADRQVSYWQGEHNGYHRLPTPVRHRRAIVRLPSDTWLIVDSLQSTARHRYRLHWLFCDFPYEWEAETGSLLLQTTDGHYQIKLGGIINSTKQSITRADRLSPRGWTSQYYLGRAPAISVTSEAATDSMCFYTFLGPGAHTFAFEKDCLFVETRRTAAAVQLSLGSQSAVVGSINLSGTISTRLVVT